VSDPIDFILGVIILLYALSGWRRGFVATALGLGGTVFAGWLALTYYRPLGLYVLHWWPDLPRPVASVLAFLFILVAGSTLFSWVVGWTLGGLRSAVREVDALRWLDAVGGVALGAVIGAAAAAIVATLIALAPLPGDVRGSVERSRLGGPLVERASELTPVIEPILAQVAEDTLTMIPRPPTGEPRSDLNFPRDLALSVDHEAEQRLFELVNEERVRHGLKPLRWDERLAEAGRRHAEEMFRLSYFAHESPVTGQPVNRARAAGAQFIVLGENLAYAPSTEIAHKGLMESPGHRANIMSPMFGRVGIGVVRGGIYGRMFAQEFAN